MDANRSNADHMSADRMSVDSKGAMPQRLIQQAATLKGHLLQQIASHSVTQAPFFHCFIEDIFPSSFYELLINYKQAIKAAGIFQSRHQDGSTYTNQRFRLFSTRHAAAWLLKTTFSDRDVSRALLEKFYISPDTLTPRLTIHREFEFVFFCRQDLFQDIHIDIAPKVLSFVFYLPSERVDETQARANATVLYDKQLKPSGAARYQPNSACIFAPHFYSYHGFSTTIERDVLVMFYVDRRELMRWEAFSKLAPIHKLDRPPYTMVKQAIRRKLRRFPLKEYGDDSNKLEQEMRQCLVNRPLGRAMNADQQP